MTSREAPSRPGGDERAVSPIIGTMFVFVIIVMGMAGGLVFGVPAIKGLQDRASIEDMAGQLENVREEAERLTVEGAGSGVSLSLASGTLALENGTKMAVAISYNGTSSQQGLSLAWGKGGSKKNNVDVSGTLPCDFHVKDWADGDAYLNLTAKNCEVPLVWNPADQTTSTVECNSQGKACKIKKSAKSTDASKCFNQAGSACLQAFKLSDPAKVNRIMSIAANGDSTYLVRLNASLSGDWFFQMSNDPTDPSNDTLLAKSYIFEMDKLRWVHDAGLTTWLEGGAVFGTRLDTQYVIDDPLIDEDFNDDPSCPAGSALARCQPTYYMRLIRFRGDQSSYSAGAGVIETHLRHLDTQSTTNDGVSFMRMDFAGEGAPLWCNALLSRAAPAGYVYVEHEFDNDAARETRCDGHPNTGVQSVAFGYNIACDPQNTAQDTPTECLQYLRANKRYFQVVFTEVHFDVKLRP